MLKKKILWFLVTAAIVILALYLSLGRVLVYFLEQNYNLSISYKSARGQFSYGELKVVDKKTGMGFFADEAFFKPRLENGLAVGFDLKKVHFIRDKQEAAGETYDTLTGLVATPFDSQWVYKQITGDVVLFDNGVKVKQFSAISDEIKLSFTGDLYRNNNLKLDISIYFGDSITNKIPGEVSGILLNAEKDNWKSLMVHIEGNYKEPSIQVSSKRFRLRIRTAS